MSDVRSVIGRAAIVVGIFAAAFFVDRDMKRRADDAYHKGFAASVEAATDRKVAVLTADIPEGGRCRDLSITYCKDATCKVDDAPVDGLCRVEVYADGGGGGK